LIESLAIAYHHPDLDIKPVPIKKSLLLPGKPSEKPVSVGRKQSERVTASQLEAKARMDRKLAVRVRNWNQRDDPDLI
jgi:hypothetical protein